MNMKRILAALLACVMVLGLAACGTTDAPEAQQPAASPANSVMASFGESYDTSVNINIYPEEDGRFLLDYIDAEGNSQRGYVDEALMTELANIYANNNLAELNEKEEYGEAENFASLTMDFADGSTFGCYFAGEVPEALTTALTAMNDAVAAATATMEVYKAEVDFAEDVNADVKAALEAVFAHLGNDALDMTMGMAVPADDPAYGNMIGLETMDETKDITPIVNAVLEQTSGTTVVQNMMGTLAHQITVFQLNDGADAAALGASLMENAGWRKWVCVAPDMALTATKDNMLLFSLTLTDIGTDLVAGLEAEGWTVTAAAENPGAGDGAMAGAPEL